MRRDRRLILGVDGGVRVGVLTRRYLHDEPGEAIKAALDPAGSGNLGEGDLGPRTASAGPGRPENVGS